MDNLVITIQYDCNELFAKQLKYLSGLGIKIIDYYNIPPNEYLLKILKLTNYNWVLSINESTFINDINDIMVTIEYMKKNNIIIAGISNGGLYTIGNGSPYIFNHSFNIFHIEKININEKLIEQKIKNWEVDDEIKKIEQCNKLKKKVFVPYKITFPINLHFDNYYPIFINLLETYKSYYFLVKNAEEKEFNKCPAVNIYSPNNKLIGTYCSFGVYYNQNNIKLDIGINNIVTFDNKKRIDYYYNKTCLNKLSKLSIEYNCLKYYYYNYSDLYYKYFQKIKANKLNILNIGLYDNNPHLSVLSDYFPNATIYSIDKNKKAVENQNNKNLKSIKTIYCDIQSDACLKLFTNNKPLFDIIIDNGVFNCCDQLNCLGVLFSNLNSNGIYICENIQMVNNLNKYGVVDKSINKTNAFYLKNLKDIKPLFITKKNYEYINDTIENIEYTNINRQPIKCIKCNNFLDNCNCNIKLEHSACVIIKKKGY